MVRLFIENTEVELDKSVQFALTKQFEDLSNPTAIKNTWSKTVSLPFTQSNNNLFGHIYNPDRLTATGGSKYIGIYFDPQKQLDCRLQWNDTILLLGYALLNEVKRDGDNKGTYEITLYGQLGKVLNELNQYTFNPNGDADYVIDASSMDFRLDRSYVQTHIISTPPDKVNFALNNALSKDFDYKTIQNSSNGSIEFKELLNSDKTLFEARTGISLESVIGKGLKPYDLKEFRSWALIPYMYMSQLFSLVNTKLEDRTGYSFEYDDNWFSDSNPYWRRFVFTLNHPDMSDYKTYLNRYRVNHNEWNVGGIFYYNLTRSSSQTQTQYTATYSDYIRYNVESQYSGYEQLPIVNSYALSINLDNYDYVLSNLQMLVYNSANSGGDTWNDYAYFKVNVRLYDSYNGNTLFQDDYYYCNEDTAEIMKRIYKNRNYIGVPTTVDTTSQTINGNTYNMHYWQLNLPNVYVNKYMSQGHNVIVQMTYNFEGVYVFAGDNPPSVYAILGRTNAVNYVTDTYIDINPNNKSFSNVKLYQLWDEEKSIFTMLTNYCKIFGIIWEVDDINKKIKLIQRKNYFSNYTIEDWTDRVDYSKPIIVKPLMTDKHYLKFNYDDIQTELSSQYNKTTGYNVGEKRINTYYSFNDDTQDMLKGLKNSNAYTPNRLEYDKLFNCQLSYYGTSTVMIDNANKDDAEVNNFGSFYLSNGGKTISPNVYITDDNFYQKSNKKSMYGGGNGKQIGSATASLPLSTYIQISLLRREFNANLLSVMEKPSVSYINNEDFTGCNSIYSALWQNYINERYNLQNKQVTFYIKMSPMQWQAFRFNHFVKIENQIYIVNKIYDYDITSSSPVKMDLITILDISAYYS